MKISKREKIMLSSLGIVLVGAIYYQFVYSKQTQKVEALEIQRNEVEDKYNEVIDTIRSLEQKQDRINSMYSTLDVKASKYYSYIIQENLILDLNSMLLDSELTGDLSFTELEVKSVESSTFSNIMKQNSSIHQLVERYENAENSTQEVINSNIDEEVSIDTSTDENNVQNESTENQEDSSEITVEQMSATLTYKGTFSQLKTFISKIEKSTKKIVITNCSITTDADDKVSGSINLEFYAIPNLGDIKSYYENWDISELSGKEIPFNSMNTSVGFSGTSNADSKSDFIIEVNPESSDLPTVTIGKSNDSQRSTYIEADNVGIETIEITLKNEGNKYYYTYRTSKNLYPGENKVAEFKPNSENINIDINSEPRLNSNDKSGIKLTVKNNTNKKINVNINSDDKERPRVTVAGEGSNISVIKK
ncbi:pilus assembly protein PilO [Romboutsia sp. Marseille-P6047]|uniref:pilus assembly protein PilO n=1 Tax=Romboutsia sp. Marseille-P6047 TaxID=2161817 RepID=UPI000F05097E|nr:pilus assembly protein PilO [Romboutsia sp. Marseille-P6047]